MNQQFLVLLLVLASAETFNPSTDYCACDKIKSEADCGTVYICAWTAAVAATQTTVAVAGFCSDATITPTPAALAHCPQVSDPATNCWKTLGCAFVDNNCTHFTGCTAYVKTTNSECQAISSLCITDGTQCINAKACNDYPTETQCTTSVSISGILKCKWDNNACRDYVCTEAVTTLTTNLACSNWLSGCVTTGKGCIGTLGVCASYAGDYVACSGLIGTDGNCEGAISGTSCTPRRCSQAPITVLTDTDCKAYQVGCITNGKGCVTSPLPACVSYSGDNTTCVGYKGSDGICEGDSGATNCRSRICSNAPAINITDTLCNAYKAGCVTTGKGCVATKSACSSYLGNPITCVEYIGSDGYCKGNNLLVDSPCTPKVCSEAPIITMTDAGCVLYQLGCKSTGKGCVSALGLCSSYLGTISTCEGYIGSDGKCKGTLLDTLTCDGQLDLLGNCIGSMGPCTPKICTDAPTSTSTNEACASYQTGCVTTGSGCVAISACLETIKSLTCLGAIGCGWNSICVASQNCSDFKTISICNGNSAILVSGGTTTTIPCFWTGSVCRDLACTDAPNTINSDSLCNTFLSGCMTNGNGCLASTASCLSYKGTRAVCSAFTRKCYNIEGAIATTPCTERVCSDDVTSTTDLACNSFKTDCRTKGTGCIDPSKLCSDYSGIQSACDAFRGSNGTIRCWSLSTTVSSTCLDKTCVHLASATSNSGCEAFLSGCLYSGVGCVTKSQPCSAYTGTQSQCNSFKANNGADTCWNISTTVSGSCVVKNCGHSGALTTDTDCKAFLDSCLTTGSGCISKTAPCSSYIGTLTQCEAFTGNSIGCNKIDVCAERACTDKASGVVDNTECTTYLASCRYFNGGCVEKRVCTSYTGDTLAKCQDVLDSSLIPKKCWWVTGTACVTRTCANAPTVTSQQNCTDHLDTCIFNGSQCFAQGTCASYTAYGADIATKQANCGAMKNSSSKNCWNSGGAQCEDSTCTNVPTPTSKASCDNHIGDQTSCWWNGTACVSSNICTNYIPTGASDSVKLAICQAMKDTSPTPITCYFVTGTPNCVSKTCSNVPTPTSQASCDSHLSGKCAWDGTACVILGNCNSYTPTGGSNIINKTICEALVNGNPTPGKCTFTIGISTCVNRTCQNITSPTSSNDCAQWLSSCQWNGRYCESTSNFPNYTPFGIDPAARTALCGTLTDGALIPQYCTQPTYTAPATCTARICSTFTSPQGAIECTNYSSTCRWSGIGSCVAASGCTLYSVIAATGAAQCAILTDISGAICSYGSGVACSVPICANKKNATNQADCTIQGTDCRYVGLGTCKDAVACTYTVTEIYGDPAKKVACENATNTTGTIKCAFEPAAIVCTPRKDCTGYYATSYAVCSQIIDSDGISCNYTSAGTCRSTVCADKIDATNLADCSNFLTKCRYVGVGTCLTQAACTYDVATVGSDLVKKALCESLTDAFNVHCAFVPAATSCSPRVECTSYAGSSLATCSKVVDVNGNLCSYSAGVICAVGNCSSKIDAVNAADCKIQGDGCRYLGVATCATAGACTSYNVSGTDGVKLSLCNVLTDAGGLFCTWVSGTPNTCVPKTCSNIISPSTNAECIAWLGTCTFTGSGCITKVVCGNYTPPGLDNTAKRSYCSAILDNSTPQLQCGYTDNASNCESRSCSNCGPQTSHTACKAWLSTCTYNGVGCVLAAACNSYTIASLSNSTTDIAQYDQCRAIKDSIGDGCDLNLQKCVVKTCANIMPMPTSYSDCINWKKSCRFTGSLCVEAVACTYTLTGDYASLSKTNAEKVTLCNGLEDNSDSTPKIFCTLTAPGALVSVCTTRSCSNIDPAPTTVDNCRNWLSNCTYNLQGLCIQNTTACASFTGLPIQCQSEMGTTQKCWSVQGASTTLPQVCKIRECTDNTTSITNAECELFLSGCKTNGAGCILNSATCSVSSGNSTTCAAFKGSDGVSLCKVSTSISSACKDKVCADDGLSTSNAQCQSFKNGCLTNGKGCIPSSEPCSKYQGTQSICSGFIGNGKKCWNPSSVTLTTTFCVDKKCSDDSTSTTDITCNSSLTDCVTKGAGCIEKTAGCGSYQGLQAICSVFKGENGTKLCWNISGATSTTPCINKTCSHNTSATTDTDCETFLPRISGAIIPQCVTTGTGCVTYPRTCLGFTGTNEQCGKFTATDGPCKTTATGSISATGICTPRICSEALNSNNTDALCKAYHPTCVTTGYGCALSVSCSTIQEQNSCSVKIGCSWVSNCRSIETDCSSLTASGASICVNTPVSTGTKKCSWYNNICRAQTCNDLPATLVSHSSCSFQISTCTTTGAGCITMGTCSSYANEVICKAAKTTDIGDTCVWDTNACRAKQCTDAPIGTSTDTGCQSYLAGCKTTGTSCATSVACSALLTVTACQVDGNGNPCLFVNNQCYSYAKCEDAVMTTHSACQQFSPLCTTDGVQCMAITTCANTINQISCVVGTDGICGWLQANGTNPAKCQKFVACSDSLATDNTSCIAYGSNCITDGTKCIEQSSCSTYITQIACETNEACLFISSSSTCRLRECTDATATNSSGGITTHSGCYGFTAKNKCTTNGTTCIDFQTCASYTVEVGCFEGTDGLCVYALPVGQTTGTIACRVKVCGDFTLATSTSCSIAITGAELGTGCVSDGTTCIVKTTCASYTSKEACNGGGTDGQCAYTPGNITTPNVGTCKLMAACIDANYDTLACFANSEACKWSEPTVDILTTSCNPHTCATKATTSICNPVPSFDLKTYTICGPTITEGCTEVLGNTLLASTCQLYTLKTFVWDETNQKCVSCYISSTTDNTLPETTTSGLIIQSIASLVILAILLT